MVRSVLAANRIGKRIGTLGNAATAGNPLDSMHRIPSMINSLENSHEETFADNDGGW
jgi:hypothetical protein